MSQFEIDGYSLTAEEILVCAAEMRKRKLQQKRQRAIESAVRIWDHPKWRLRRWFLKLMGTPVEVTREKWVAYVTWRWDQPGHEGDYEDFMLTDEYKNVQAQKES